LETRDIQIQSVNVQVLPRLAPDLPATKADADQLEQVLANLVTNESRRSITISVTRDRSDDGEGAATRFA